MSGKGIIILVLIVAAIPALFMLLVGVLGKFEDKRGRQIK